MEDKIPKTPIDLLQIQTLALENIKNISKQLLDQQNQFQNANLLWLQAISKSVDSTTRYVKTIYTIIIVLLILAIIGACITAFSTMSTIASWAT